MPPIGQQGSRGALITWSVICSILFVTATIFAIYFYVVANETQGKLGDQQKKYADVVNDSNLTGPVVTELTRLRAEADQAPVLNPSMTALDAAVAQRNALMALVGGPAAKPQTAVNDAKRTMAETAQKLKTANLTLPVDNNLMLAVTTLAGGLQARMDEIAQLNQQLAAAKQQQVADQEALQAATAKMEETIKQVRAEAGTAVEGAKTYQTTKDADVQTITASATEAQKTAQEALAARDLQIKERDQKIEQLTTNFDALKERFFGRRADTVNPTIRQADGHIVRVPSKDIVFIDIGQSDGVPPGMTFEVYDKNEGIPTVPTNVQNNDDPTLPIGKASIEVIKVHPTMSQCRVTRSAHGAVVSDGDPIVNLVYDKNTKFNFLVYGNFDMDQNGQASPADADVIKRLVTSFGGNLTEKVGVGTDFVVLGKEPEIPVFDAEERDNPFNQKRLLEAQQELDAYLNVLKAATDMRIPVLNQNRFLYLVGYYNQATR
jgi:hypothetical protein